MKYPLTKWWDGYDPDEHSVVVMDEYDHDPTKVKDEMVALFLQWTDGYRQNGEVKGASVPLIYEYVFVTSTDHPNMYFNPQTYTQVERRFHGHIIEVLDNEQEIVFE